MEGTQQFKEDEMLPTVGKPTETHLLPASEEVGEFSEEERKRILLRIEAINKDIKALSNQARPLRDSLRSLYNEITNLNKKRHALQIALVEVEHLPKTGSVDAIPPNPNKTWIEKKRAFGPIRSKKELDKFFKTLTRAELEAFQALASGKI